MRFAKDIVPNIDELPTRQRSSFREIEDELFWEYYELCKNYSMVHVTAFYNVYQTFNYLAKNGIRGNAVECGCFLGGIAKFMGLLRKRLGLSDMEIILFDTFEGPPVGSTDSVWGTRIETPYLLPNYRELVPASIKEVVGSLEGYRFVVGLVEDTIPKTDTGDLAVLRLDTDFYPSTKIEFEILYPRLVKGGAIIVDDYGLFQGSRTATDEYFASITNPPLMNRIDVGVWAGVKP
jgi:O-methyltransferase